MSQTARVLLKVDGDGNDARRTLKEVIRGVREVDAEKAEVKVEVDNRTALQRLRDTVREVRNVDGLTATAKVDLETAGVQAKLDQVKARLVALSQQDASPGVDVKIGAASAQIQRLELQLAKLDAKRVEVNVGVNTPQIALATTALGRFTQGLSGVGPAATSAGGGAAAAGTEFSVMGFSAGPAGIAVLALAASIGVNLVAALGALVSSAALAVGGLGALAVAGGGFLAGALALGIGAMGYFKATVGTTGSAANLLQQSITRLGTAFRTAVTPASIAVFQGLRTLLTTIRPSVAGLQSSFSTLGLAVKAAFIGAQVPATSLVSAFGRMVAASAPLAGPIVQGLLALGRILVNIATAAMPSLISGARQVATSLRSWAQSTSNTSALSAVIRGLVGHLKVWWGVAKSIGTAFLEMIKAAAPEGKKLAVEIKKVADRLTEWAKSAKGRAEIKAFLQRAVPQAIEFAKNVYKIVAAFVKLANDAAPAVTNALKLINAVLDVVKGKDGAFKEAGAALITNLGSGILGQLIPAVGAAQKVASAIRGVFPGSEPEDSSSPLSKLADAGRAIFGNLAQGMRAGTPVAVAAAHDATERVRAKLEALEGHTSAAARRMKESLKRELTRLEGLENFQKQLYTLQHTLQQTALKARDAFISMRTSTQLAALDQGPEAQEIGRLTTQSDQVRRAQEEQGLAKRLAEARAAGDRDAVKQAELDIAEFKRQQRIAELQRELDAKRRSVENQAEIARMGNDKEADAYAGSLEDRLGLLYKNLASGKIAYQQFAREIYRILSPLGLSFDIGPEEAAGLRRPKSTRRSSRRTRLASGGLVSGPTNALIGEGRHREAVLPLSSKVMGDLANAITAQMQIPSIPTPSFAGQSFGGNTVNQTFQVPQPAPQQGFDTNDLVNKLSLVLGQQGASTRR
jgi:hypothetical protein